MLVPVVSFSLSLLMPAPTWAQAASTTQRPEPGLLHCTVPCNAPAFVTHKMRATHSLAKAPPECHAGHKKALQAARGPPITAGLCPNLWGLGTHELPSFGRYSRVTLTPHPITAGLCPVALGTQSRQPPPWHMTLTLLHSGHALRVFSHRWMQSKWNTWPHTPHAMLRPGWSGSPVGLAYGRNQWGCRCANAGEQSPHRGAAAWGCSMGVQHGGAVGAQEGRGGTAPGA